MHRPRVLATVANPMAVAELAAKCVVTTRPKVVLDEVRGTLFVLVEHELADAQPV